MRTRIRLPIGRSLFFLSVLAVGLVLLLPMRLALGWLDLAAAGFSAREARGSVWRGTLTEARFAGAPLGDLSAGLAPTPLLLGRARIGVSRAGEGGDPLDGAIVASRHSLGVDGVTAHIPLGARMLPLPVAAVDLSAVSITFRDGLCDRAEGLVKAAISGAPAGLNLPGGLSGAARCDGGALLLPLMSQSGMESLMLHVSAGGAYRADLRVRPTTPAARDALVAAGFAPAAGGLALVVTGSL